MLKTYKIPNPGLFLGATNPDSVSYHCPCRRTPKPLLKRKSRRSYLLQGQGKFGEAPLLFVSAIQADASDARPLRHLIELVQAHPEINSEVPKLADQIEACRRAVEYARSRQPDFEARWKGKHEKQKKNLPIKIKNVIF